MRSASEFQPPRICSGASCNFRAICTFFHIYYCEANLDNYYCAVKVVATYWRDAVTSHKPQPPWEFLLSASHTSLHSYELSRLNHAANLRKEIGALLDQWMEESASAMLARWLMEHRERSPNTVEAFSSAESRTRGAHSVSDNFLPDQPASRPVTRGVI